jgi:predicted transcriptional regulator of viral defense system
MIIGSEFSNTARVLLSEIALQSNSNSEEIVSVDPLCSKLEIERNEAKNLLEYLEDKGYICIESIGGCIFVWISPYNSKRISKVN